MDFTLLAYLTYQTITVLAVERFMHGFFGERRTGRAVLVLSFAVYFVVTAANFLLLTIPTLMITVSTLGMFLLTLNYTAKWFKRIFVALGISMIILTVEGLFAYFVQLYVPAVTVPVDTLAPEFVWVFMAMGPIVYILSIVFLRFKNLKSNTVSMPGLFWVSSVLIPAVTIALFMVALIHLPQVAGIMSVLSLFFINLMMFYLHNTLSKVYEDKLAAKDEFLAKMSHEIRTPISAVMGVSEMQLRNSDMPPHAKEALTNIYNYSTTLLAVAADLLDSSKKEGMDSSELSSHVGARDTHRHTLDLEFKPTQFAGGKVLVVDDIDTNLYVAAAMLESFALDVALCSSGEEAIEHIKQGHVYDVIFMDYMMPGLDGIKTTQQLHAMGYARPIVALTANAVLGHDKIFAENGFSGYMAKPIDIKLLNTYLMQFIGA